MGFLTHFTFPDRSGTWPCKALWFHPFLKHSTLLFLLSLPSLHRNGRQATLVISMCAECFQRTQSRCGLAQASRDPLGSMIAVPLPGSILYALLGTSRNSNLLSWPEYLPQVLPLPCQVLEEGSDLFPPPVAAGISEHSENYYLRSMREFEPGDVSIYLCHTAEGCWCRWHTSRQ